MHKIWARIVYAHTPLLNKLVDISSNTCVLMFVRANFYFHTLGVPGAKDLARHQVDLSKGSYETSLFAYAISTKFSLQRGQNFDF